MMFRTSDQEGGSVHGYTRIDLRGVLGMRLRHAREGAGLRQEEAATKLGYQQSTLSRIEMGGRNIDVFELQAMAELYGANFDELRAAPTVDELIQSRNELEQLQRRRD